MGYLSQLLLTISLLPIISNGETIPDWSNWCFVKEGCNQDSPNSPWNSGYCKSGKFQSPIDIINDPAGISGDAVIDFSQTIANYELTGFQLKNDGKHVELTNLQTVTGRPAKFTRSDQQGVVYTLREIHIHWGPTNDNGSEHSIGGRSYAMEIHLVHLRTAGRNGEFRSFEEAMESGKEGALSTIAIMVEVDAPNSVSDSLKPLLDDLHKIYQRGAKTDGIGRLRIGDLIKAQGKAAVYDGSVTIPPCEEVVTWVVALTPVSLTADQVDIFRTKIQGMDRKPLVTNRRRIQDGKDRVVGVLNFKH